MKKRNSYSYALLNFVHDRSTGEFVTVGVVISSPSEKRIIYKFRKTLGRIGDIYPEIGSTRFKKLMNDISMSFQGKFPCEDIETNEKFESSLDKVLNSVLLKDDSALQWGLRANGITANLDETMRHLYQRYVGKYDREKKNHGKSDEDLKRSFKKELETRRILSFFEKKTISGENDDVKFDFAWKNGIWHCIEPVSFDLSAVDSIKDKARRCAGEMVSISDVAEQFKIYWLLAKPNNPDFLDAYNKAIGILNNVKGVDIEIYSEEDKSLLIDLLGEKIESHIERGLI